MRTTITIDDDIHRFVSYYAQARGLTFSAAVGELIRKAEAAPEPEPDIRRGPNGFPMFPPVHDGAALTLETVKKIEEDEFDPKTLTRP